ncbi:hypothetical protein Droror1_Dr00006038 [Drosera rotundifolia]
MLLNSSSFEDMFDVDHFIEALKDDVTIVRDLPYEYSWSTREYYATAIRETRVKSAPIHASANWYKFNVLPILHSKINEVYGRSKEESRDRYREQRISERGTPNGDRRAEIDGLGKVPCSLPACGIAAGKT